MRVIIDIVGEKGTTFALSLHSHQAFVSSGTWMCPPGYLLVFTGVFRFLGGGVKLFSSDPGYLLGDIEDVSMPANLKNFNAKKGASGEVIIYDQGPLGRQLSFSEKWTVRESIGIGEITYKSPYGWWDK